MVQSAHIARLQQMHPPESDLTYYANDLQVQESLSLSTIRRQLEHCQNSLAVVDYDRRVRTAMRVDADDET